jgi:hypothetical protein
MNASTTASGDFGVRLRGSGGLDVNWHAEDAVVLRLETAMKLINWTPHDRRHRFSVGREGETGARAIAHEELCQFEQDIESLGRQFLNVVDDNHHRRSDRRTTKKMFQRFRDGIAISPTGRFLDQECAERFHILRCATALDEDFLNIMFSVRELPVEQRERGEPGEQSPKKIVSHAHRVDAKRRDSRLTHTGSELVEQARLANAADAANID